MCEKQHAVSTVSALLALLAVVFALFLLLNLGYSGRIVGKLLQMKSSPVVSEMTIGNGYKKN